MTTTFSNKIETWAAVACVLVGLAGSGCSKTTSGAEPKRAPDVEVVPVEQRDIPVYREWIGVLDGMVNAAIRAQVTGYLVRQTYSEGSFVKKGQLLFEIDARPFQAAVEQANGQLAHNQRDLAFQFSHTIGDEHHIYIYSGRSSCIMPMNISGKGDKG